jgi:hypothetical protein
VSTNDDGDTAPPPQREQGPVLLGPLCELPVCAAREVNIPAI